GAGERLSRAAGQPVWRDPETGYVRRQLFSRPDHPVELVRVELPARQRVALPASSYAHIRQLVWVQSGSLVITEGSERHALAAGDCLGFGLPAETTFANETNATCTYVVAAPIRAALGELLGETVASGGSVGFMHPLPPGDADA
ncbi:hypothetical protein KXV85_004942, partial [Aspergillus fumigatus]